MPTDSVACFIAACITFLAFVGMVHRRGYFELKTWFFRFTVTDKPPPAKSKT